ncbi:hypothetical protein RYX36_031301 [Vicia faba]
MAKLLALSLSLCFLLFSSCFALREQSQQNECQLERLDALEPDNRIESEGGLIETWNPNNRQFRCARVALSRATLQRNALRRPYYSNAPQEIYIQQGNGYFGMVFPGCPETFEEPQQSEQGEGRRYRDSHQKVNRFREGDIIAVPTGIVFWMYNDQDTPVIAISLTDTGSSNNQLDQMPRRFYLAGNQEQEFLRYQHQQGGKEEQDNDGNNIFSGFKRDFLEDALNVNRHIVDRLQGRNEDEEKGAIVKVKGKRATREAADKKKMKMKMKMKRKRDNQAIIKAGEDEDDKEKRHSQKGESRRHGDNGLEETVCTAKLRLNIGSSSSPDIYNPQAGTTSAINALPLDVVAATFNLQRNEARQLKSNNPFKFLVPPRESEKRASA